MSNKKVKTVHNMGLMLVGLLLAGICGFCLYVVGKVLYQYGTTGHLVNGWQVLAPLIISALTGSVAIDCFVKGTRVVLPSGELRKWSWREDYKKGKTRSN